MMFFIACRGRGAYYGGSQRSLLFILSFVITENLDNSKPLTTGRSSDCSTVQNRWKLQ